jgi:hypothetical protein
MKTDEKMNNVMMMFHVPLVVPKRSARPMNFSQKYGNLEEKEKEEEEECGNCDLFGNETY